MADNSAGHSPGGKEEDLVAESSLSGTEMPGQLLRFAERISDDIQRYFGRKSKEEGSDACNIYEDCCSPQVSGQVLYYTDLVRISQGRELEEEEEGPSASPKPPEQVEGKLQRSFCSKDEAEKLGPLAELFEYGLRRCAKQPFPSGNKKVRLKYGHVPPMHSRKLPPSFWKEPSLSPICMLNGNPPDFSDLLANWTSETCQEDLNASREHTGEGNQQVTDADHFGGL
ncbi:protein PERCC1 [Sceloporus undulatus]|uniref:protein PERCC1 n=1 Tax=Sceloporus undulatus TaxID=8520 RepID=UPI001C4C6346|nr:protein PERCC1 [Sceloporus undulatus]